jgi:uncharacterized LabA/DUF88 family protein
MTRVRAALYLDFDNVFGGLLQVDPDAAIQFAEEPGSWLDRLASSLTVDGQRRWLVLRCYMNPAGWVPHPKPSAGVPRLYFSRFRPFFTRAGFDVVDCPRLTHTKNGADIRMVVDAMDALNSSASYDEFVIASGDADMTALLVRLRAADRRTTIMSPSDAAEAFTAVADRLINGQQVLELVQGEPDADEQIPAADETSHEAPIEAAPARTTIQAKPHTPPPKSVSADVFASMVRARYSEADGPLNLASVAQEVRAELGNDIDATGWFGAGGFARALERLDLPDLKLSQYWMWDGSRHDPPDNASTTQGHGFALPDPVARLSTVLDLPRLPQHSWPPLYRTLAEFAVTHHFSLTEATRWTRDRLAEQGVEVGRNVVGFVTRGATYGGRPLYTQPAPTAAEIAAAFANNLLSRADAAAMELTAEDAAVVRAWLGASQSGSCTG